MLGKGLERTKRIEWENSTLLNNAVTNVNIVFHPSKLHFLPLVALSPCLCFDKLFSPSLPSAALSVPKPGSNPLHSSEKGEKECQTNATRPCTIISAGKVHRLPPKEAVVKFDQRGHGCEALWECRENSLSETINSERAVGEPPISALLPQGGSPPPWAKEKLPNNHGIISPHICDPSCTQALKIKWDYQELVAYEGHNNPITAQQWIYNPLTRVQVRNLNINSIQDVWLKWKIVF